jgi:hypothetical protein
MLLIPKSTSNQSFNLSPSFRELRSRITASNQQLCVVKFLQQKKCINTTSHVQVRSIYTPSPRLPMRDLNQIPRLHHQSAISSLIPLLFISLFPPRDYQKKGLKTTYGDLDFRRYNAQPKAAHKDLPINNPSTTHPVPSPSLHPHSSPYPPSRLSSSSHTPHHEHPPKQSIDFSR